MCKGHFSQRLTAFADNSHGDEEVKAYVAKMAVFWCDAVAKEAGEVQAPQQAVVENTLVFNLPWDSEAEALLPPPGLPQPVPVLPPVFPALSVNPPPCPPVGLLVGPVVFSAVVAGPAESAPARPSRHAPKVHHPGEGY